MGRFSFETALLRQTLLNHSGQPNLAETQASYIEVVLENRQVAPALR